MLRMVHAEWLAFGGCVRGQLPAAAGAERHWQLGLGSAPQFILADNVNIDQLFAFHLSVVYASHFSIYRTVASHKDVLQSGYPTAFDEFRYRLPEFGGARRRTTTAPTITMPSLEPRQSY